MSEEKLKLLFVTNDLYPFLNANSEIVYRLAAFLQNRYNCDISILGVEKRKSGPVLYDPYGFKTFKIQSIMELESIQSDSNNRWIRLIKTIIKPQCFRFLLARKIHDPYAQCKEYQYTIHRAVCKNEYDCIVGFCVPFDSLRALSRLHLQIPFIAYKLDPWATYYNMKNREREYRDERKADKAAAAIIVTDLIRQEYLETKDKNVIRKIHVLKFPNIIRYENEPLLLKDSEATHCVFTGALYKKIRNPLYTVSLFEALKANRIEFHLFGKSYGGTGLPNILPDNVINHGQVTSDEALRYMQGADILVNIGNTVLNQMPSKILTYISLGKPILNIIKTPECPTLPYLEKYPLVLNVLETEEPTEEDVARVRDFIINSKGKRIPFEKIEKLYYDCTPEYVGGKVYDIICDVVKKSKRG